MQITLPRALAVAAVVLFFVVMFASAASMGFFGDMFTGVFGDMFGDMFGSATETFTTGTSGAVRATPTIRR